MNSTRTPSPAVGIAARWLLTRLFLYAFVAQLLTLTVIGVFGLGKGGEFVLAAVAIEILVSILLAKYRFKDSWPGTLESVDMFIAHFPSAESRADNRPQFNPLSQAPALKNRPLLKIPDAALLFLFTGTGVALVVRSKLRGEYGIWTAALLVFLLLSYATLARTIGASRSPSRLGDNCYYMGFLFTLVSLTAALFQMKPPSSGQATSNLAALTGSGVGLSDDRGIFLDGLIASFGIALVSTIAGVALRVLFIQARDPTDELDFQSVPGTPVAQARVSVDQHPVLREPEQALAALLHDVALGMRTFQQAFSEMADSTVENVGALNARLSGLGKIPDQMHLQARALHEQTIALHEALKAVVQVERMREIELIDATRRLNEEMQSIADVAPAARIEAAVERLTQGLETAGALTATLETNLSRYIVAVERLSATTETERVAIASVRSLIEADVRQSRESLHLLQGTLADVANAIVRRLEVRE